MVTLAVRGARGNNADAALDAALRDDGMGSPFNAFAGLLLVTILLSGLAVVIGVATALAVVFVEPIAFDRYYRRWYRERIRVKMQEELRMERHDARNGNANESATMTEGSKADLLPVKTFA